MRSAAVASASIAETGRAARAAERALVEAAYGDLTGQPTRLLHFRVEVRDLAQFCDFARVVGTLNTFDAERVIAAIAPIFDRLATVEIGREQSPVIHARPAAGYNAPGAHERAVANANAFVRAARAAGASEVGEVYFGILPDGAEYGPEDHVVRLRARWD